MAKLKEETRGRKRKKIDIDELMKLALIDCSTGEIAAHFGVGKDLILRRYGHLISQAKEKGKILLRKEVFDQAINQHNWKATEHLSKTRLKNIEQQDVRLSGDQDNPVQVEQTINLNNLTIEELEQYHNLLEKVT